LIEGDVSNPREDELLFFIGGMADSFARLESRIVDYFACLVNAENPRIGEVISDRLSLNQTVNLIGAILKDLQNTNACRQFALLSKEVEKAAAMRNDILHSSWATPSADDTSECDIIQLRARKRYVGLTEHDLDDLIRRIEDGTFFMQEV
jgi:hypothetical protein